MYAVLRTVERALTRGLYIRVVAHRQLQITTVSETEQSSVKHHECSSALTVLDTCAAESDDYQDLRIRASTIEKADLQMCLASNEPETSKTMRQSLNSENVPPMLGEESKTGVDAHPKKSGPVYMTQNIGGRSRKVRVVLSVYSNSYDSYVVVSQDRALCKDCGYISLRNSNVQKQNSNLVIVPQNGEGQTLSFTVTDTKDLDSWLDTLRAIEDSINNPEQEEGQAKRVKRRPLGQLPQRCPSIRRKPVMPALTEEGCEE